MRASFIYHQTTAVISIVATFLFLISIYYNYNSLNLFTISVGLLIVSISWGIHGLLHFCEEFIYNYEPVSGRTKVYNYPVYPYQFSQ